MPTGVYLIRNVRTAKVYVGSAVDIDRRIRTHFWALRQHRHHNARLQAAWDRDGEPAFAVEVLELVRRDDLIKAEQRHIDDRRAADQRYGYNACVVAGSTLGLPCAARTRARIGAANRGRVHSADAIRNKTAAMNRPEVQAKLHAIRRSASLRAAVSRSKGGTGRVLTDEEIPLLLARYERGDISLKALSVEIGAAVTTVRSALVKAGAKPSEDPAAIRRKISRTLVAVDPSIWREVQRLYDAGLARQHELAERFSLSRPQVCRIVHRKLACYRI